MALNSKSDLKIKKSSTAINLTEGPIVKNILLFAIPLFMGQLLQQFYNMADAWVIGNFADNDAFAAVSSAGSMTFLVVGLFNGIAIGGGVIISKYYGAKDKENVVKAIHTNFLFGIHSIYDCGFSIDAIYFGMDEDAGKCYAQFFKLLYYLLCRSIHGNHV